MFVMKSRIIKILFLVAGIILASFTFSYSFKKRTVVYSAENVMEAIKTGNANQLSMYFDNMVEITLHDKSNSYSRNQAETVIKDFFSSYGVKSFKTLHRGTNSGAEFFIGNLQTKNGDFRTTVFMKLRADKQLLREIRFETGE